VLRERSMRGVKVGTDMYCPRRDVETGSISQKEFNDLQMIFDMSSSVTDRKNSDSSECVQV